MMECESFSALYFFFKRSMKTKALFRFVFYRGDLHQCWSFSFFLIACMACACFCVWDICSKEWQRRWFALRLRFLMARTCALWVIMRVLNCHIFPLCNRNFWYKPTSLLVLYNSLLTADFKPWQIFFVTKLKFNVRFWDTFFSHLWYGKPNKSISQHTRSLLF